ncbi:hypothetical protein [Amycolatopsis sp. NPDC052450]|uniref:hypothetical protein n=1 Tax=Amycolatopsis sp. NPDC052450 TaxID=3363937 RepID=UPI0037CBDAC0
MTPLLIALAGLLGAVTGALVTRWSAHGVERKRQAFQLEQDARSERAQAMRSARVLDSALMEALALLNFSVRKNKRLWPDNLAVPDTSIWIELRGDIAAILDPKPWLRVHMGFRTVNDLRIMEGSYRALGYDETKDLPSGALEVAEPAHRLIEMAREALHPVAYPDHIRLPAGHPMLALLAEQEASKSTLGNAAPSPAPKRWFQFQRGRR